MLKQEKYLNVWLGMTDEQVEKAPTVSIITSDRHNEIMYGWLNYIPVYAFSSYYKLFISCAPGFEKDLQCLCDAQDCDEAVAMLISFFKTQSPNKFYCSKVFWLENLNPKIDSSEATRIQKQHYTEYCDFFKKKSPVIWDYINPEDELTQDFDELTEQRTSYCIFRDNTIVSCAETQASPYRPDGAVEIGVDTLEEYRGKGYAAAACVGLINHCINEGKVAIWRCKSDDIISEKLALKLGFQFLGTEYYLNSLFRGGIIPDVACEAT